MKKSELKTGMLIVNREGCMGIVMLGTSDGDVIVGDGRWDNITWYNLKDVNEDLTKNDHDFDIIEVWSYSNNRNGAKITTDERTLLWKREDYIHKLPLNKKYEAVVDLKAKTVSVGCQAFSFEKIEELAELIKKPIK